MRLITHTVSLPAFLVVDLVLIIFFFSLFTVDLTTLRKHFPDLSYLEVHMAVVHHVPLGRRKKTKLPEEIQEDGHRITFQTR